MLKQAEIFSAWY